MPTQHTGRRLLAFVSVTAVVALLLGPESSAGETLNAVNATGASRNPPTGLGAVRDIAIEAHSGPLGEDPAGDVSFAVMINRITHLEPFPFDLSGPVTCLNVVGNVALLNFDNGFPVTIKLTDEGGDGADGFDFAYGNSADDCSSMPSGGFDFDFDKILGNGRVVVRDAPPETALRHVPPVKSARRKVRFAFASSEPGTLECRLDDRSFSRCVSPRRYRRIGTGRHRFRVRSIDAGGNADPSPAAYRFRIVRPRR
jgi:hypothetical protein